MSINSYAQNNHDKAVNIDSLIVLLASDNRVEGEYLGRSAHRSEKYETFTVLKQNVDEKFLIQLTKHDSAAVRGYAFWALVEMKSKHTYKILRKHKRDKERVIYFNGCLTGELQLRYFMNTVFNDEDYSLNWFQELLIYRLVDMEFKEMEKMRKRRNKEREYNAKQKRV